MKEGSPGVGRALSGRVILIAITVAASAGGFLLGFFVGRSSVPSAQNVPAVRNPALSPTVAAPGMQPAPAGQRQEEPGPVPQSGQTLKAENTASVTADTAAPAAQKALPAGETKVAAAKQPEPAVAAPKTSKEQNNAENTVKYTVQAGAFKNRKEADALLEKLGGKGHRAEITKTTVKGTTLFRVFVGTYEKKKEAEVAALKLKKTEGLKAFVAQKEEKEKVR